MTIYETLAKKLINSSKEDAIETLEGMKVVYRIIQEDDQYFIVTMDIRDDRINLFIVDGVIINASVG